MPKEPAFKDDQFLDEPLKLIAVGIEQLHVFRQGVDLHIHTCGGRRIDETRDASQRHSLPARWSALAGSLNQSSSWVSSLNLVKDLLAH